MKTDNLKVCIVTAPIISKSGIIPLSNLIDILSWFSEKVYLITGNEFSYQSKSVKLKIIKMINYDYEARGFNKILNYAYLQLKITHYTLKIIKDTDLFIFMFGDHLILPIVTLKMCRKKVIIQLSGSISDYNKYKNSLYGKLVCKLQTFSYILSNQLIVYSPILIKQWGLELYKNKISVAHRHFINCDQFKAEIEIYKKTDIIGYVGRLSEEKGIFNFIKAIPTILQSKSECRVLIIGTGELERDIASYLEHENISENVTLVGWVPHTELHVFLNKLKLLVLPSYTEGLPNIVLESMVCNTPVLATPVGAIPNVIIDEKTGFIMENNSPMCIAKNVIRALDNSNLKEIVENANKLVNQNFTYEIAIENYMKLINNL